MMSFLKVWAGAPRESLAMRLLCVSVLCQSFNEARYRMTVTV